MFYKLFRALLFRLPPERAHGVALSLVGMAAAVPPVRWLLRQTYGAPAVAPVHALGLTFSNQVGLAAGYDKDGSAWRGLACLGFGHLELGTVTPEPQPGNPRPRVFRLPADKALINRMGFPSGGADVLARNLAGPRPPGLVLGINLGKQKETPLEEAGQDYLALLERFAPLADYLTINVSSPNTPGLRELQSRDYLEGLLAPLVRRRDELLGELKGPVPILVKLAPDLDDAQLDDALEAALGAGVDGVIATNTTISRPTLRTPTLGQETGGLSGAPLTSMSTRMIQAITHRAAGKLPVVGAGGIMGPDDARAKLDAGALLVQVYTGLIYGGPGLARAIVRGLAGQELVAH